MQEYVTLLGAERIESAANRMASAAEDMKRAASQMDEALRTQQGFMNDWLSRLEEVLKLSRDAI